MYWTHKPKFKFLPHWDFNDLFWQFLPKVTCDSCNIFRFVIYLCCFTFLSLSLSLSLSQASTLECSNLGINQWRSSGSWAVSSIPLRYAVNTVTFKKTDGRSRIRHAGWRVKAICCRQCVLLFFVVRLHSEMAFYTYVQRWLENSIWWIGKQQME